MILYIWMYNTYIYAIKNIMMLEIHKLHKWSAVCGEWYWRHYKWTCLCIEMETESDQILHEY